MKTSDSSKLGKVLYGVAFTVVLPILLVVWAKMTASSVSLPAIDSLPAGLVIGAVGAAIMLAGIAAIYFYGHGLPMNAYPPARFVTEGVYRFLPHPIYTGFCILCLGIAIGVGSASGLWLVFPTAVLGCVALVQGYEKEATNVHFGQAPAEAFIHFPRAEPNKPSWADRISALLLGVGPLCIFVGATALIGATTSRIDRLTFESIFPFYQWAETLYLSRFALIIAALFIAASSSALREFVFRSLAATGVGLLLFIAFPYGVTQPSFEPQDIVGGLVGWEHNVAVSLISISCQVAMTLIGAQGAGPRWRIILNIWALIVIAAGLLTGNQTVVSVVVGIAIFVFAVNIRRIWEFLRTCTEWVANSWTEWGFGQVRIINHGIYAAAGAFVSLSIIGVLAGPGNVPYVILIAFLAIVVSALSAQWIEGSLKLLRPFGWYGGVLGAFLGGFVAYALGGDLLLLAAAFCVGAPWVQAAGRLRCLVQGCCHGRETDAVVGIRYVHPRSRVCRLTDLEAVPVHPTPLYSILFNVIVAIIMARLWLSGGSLTLILGVYYILTGLGRFVEESLRGEPQTPVFAGLRLYQALAVLTVFGGILVTMISTGGNAPSRQFNWEAIAASTGFALFIWIAFGVDLPTSNRRFARLT